MLSFLTGFLKAGKIFLSFFEYLMFFNLKSPGWWTADKRGQCYCVQWTSKVPFHNTSIVSFYNNKNWWYSWLDKFNIGATIILFNKWTCSRINLIIWFDRCVCLVLSFKFNQMIFLFFLCFDIGNIILSKENIGNITFCLIITGWSDLFNQGGWSLGS